MHSSNNVKLDNSFMEIYVSNIDNESLFAASENISGEFFLEGLDIQINISDKEMDDVATAQKMLLSIRENDKSTHYSSEEIKYSEHIYSSFMQAHNHELTHLYQVLALPAFQLVWSTRFNLLRLEASVMLRHFELDGYFSGEKYNKILEVLEDGNSTLKKEFTQQFNDFKESYELHIYNYKKEYRGISLFFIIESMAHIMSLQLSDKPNIDMLGIGEDRDYAVAYNHFDSCVNDINLEIRWKYLLFIYICYFSCQHFEPEKGGSGFPSVHIFLFLCSRSKHYLKALKNLHKTYSPFSIKELKELKELKEFNISDTEIQNATHNQLAGLYSFFQLIEFIEDESFPKGIPKKNLTTRSLSDFFVCSQSKGINWQDKYILAKILIFPANFVWIREIYDEVMGRKGADKEYTYAEEAIFYRFIMNCKNLLQPWNNVLCCEEDGIKADRRKILWCKNEGGLAFYLQELTGKPAHKLFKF